MSVIGYLKVIFRYLHSNNIIKFAISAVHAGGPREFETIFGAA